MQATAQFNLSRADEARLWMLISSFARGTARDADLALVEALIRRGLGTRRQLRSFGVVRRGPDDLDLRVTLAPSVAAAPVDDDEPTPAPKRSIATRPRDTAASPAASPAPADRSESAAFSDAMSQVFGLVTARQGRLTQPLLTALQQLRAEVAELHVDSAARREHATRRLEAALATRQEPDAKEEALLEDMLFELQAMRADLKKPQRVLVQREDGTVREYYREQCEPTDRPIINPALNDMR